ncbi:hypothetical protein H5410_021340, partial [Solanum commersonii]
QWSQLVLRGQPARFEVQASPKADLRNGASWSGGEKQRVLMFERPPKQGRLLRPKQSSKFVPRGKSARMEVQNERQSIPGFLGIQNSIFIFCQNFSLKFGETLAMEPVCPEEQTDAF